MTYHIEHDLPIEQLNSLAQPEVKVKRALNTAGAFRGRSIKAENIGQSSDDLAREPDIDI